MIIGLDIGSSAAKAVAVDGDGGVRAATRERYPIGAAGGEGLDPAAVLACVMTCLTRTTERVGADAVEAVALSSAMHTLLIVDRESGHPGRVSTWADQGKAPTDDPALVERLDALYPVTGCPPWPVYAPARLRGMDLGDGAQVRTIKEWVLGQLTGHAWMDVMSASTTGLLDVAEGRWAQGALEVAGLREDHLPELVAPTAWGKLTSDPAREAALPAGLPVVAGGPDGPLVNLALGAAAPGDATLSIGTTAAVRVVTADIRLHPQHRTWSYRFHPGGHLAGGAVNNGGLLLDWARELLYPKLAVAEGFDRLFSEADAVPPGAEGVRMQPHMVPERDPSTGGATASFTGLRPHHGRGALARAVVDALALSLTGVVEELRVAGVEPGQVAVTGVPATFPMLAQALCDCLGRPLRVVAQPDASAIGAAMLGYEALGAARPPSRPDGATIAPAPRAAGIYAELRSEWHRTLRS